MSIALIYQYNRPAVVSAANHINAISPGGSTLDKSMYNQPEGSTLIGTPNAPPIQTRSTSPRLARSTALELTIP